MKIEFPLHNNGFYYLQEDGNKDAEKSGDYAQSYTWNTHTRPGFPTLKTVSKMTMCWTRRNTHGRWPQYIFYYQIIKIILPLIEIPNLTGSATSSCLRNTGKLGTTKAIEKRRSRDPGEIWTTSLATTLEKKIIILGTMSAQLKPVSKTMQKLSEEWIRRNPGESQRRFVQSHNGIHHRGMGWTTI